MIELSWRKTALQPEVPLTLHLASTWFKFSSGNISFVQRLITNKSISCREIESARKGPVAAGARKLVVRSLSLAAVGPGAGPLSSRALARARPLPSRRGGVARLEHQQPCTHNNQVVISFLRRAVPLTRSPVIDSSAQRKRSTILHELWF